MPERQTSPRAISIATLIVAVAIAACEILVQNVPQVVGRYLGGFLVIGAAVFAIGVILRNAPSMFSVSPTAEQGLQGVPHKGL